MNSNGPDSSSDVHAAVAGKASSGGRFTNRGIIIQTLVALLEVVNQTPPFETVTLEPPEGDDQFDFLWTRGAEKHATQVKSSKNPFQTGKIEEWAQKLADARNGQTCKLMLVGPMDTKVSELQRRGHAGVKIQTLHVSNLDDLPGLEQLRRLGSDLLADFLPTQELSAGTSEQRRDMIDKLNGELILKAASGTPTTRAEFCKTLGRWFSKEPQGTVNAYPDVVKQVNADLIRYHKAAKMLNACDDALFTKASQDIQLAPHVGAAPIDLLRLIDALSEAIENETEKDVAVGVEKLLGSLLVLAVDPVWVLQARPKLETGTFDFPGHSYEQKETPQRGINLLNIALQASADRPGNFEALFEGLDQDDELRLPTKDNLGRHVLPAEEQHGIDRRVVAHMQGIVPHNPQEFERLKIKSVEQIERAIKTRGRPYYTTDPAYKENVPELKGPALGAKSLRITICQGASDSDFMINAHNFVSPLLNIRAALQRLRRTPAA